MSVPEFAQYVGIGIRTAREEIAKRRVKFVRLGKRIILRKGDVDAYLERLVHA